MATKLFLGTQAITNSFEDKTIIRKAVSGTTLVNDTYQPLMDFTGVTTIEPYTLAYAYSDNTYPMDGSSMKYITTIGEYGAYCAFDNCTGLNNVDLRSLTVINKDKCCYGMFQNCSNLTSVKLNLTTITGQHACNYMFAHSGITGHLDLSSLKSITPKSGTYSSGAEVCYDMFYDCKNITSVDLSNLKQINGDYLCYYMFYNCTSLTSVDLSSLYETRSPANGNSMGYMFSGCTNLTNIDLSDLKNITGNSCRYTFYNCTSLTSITFDSLYGPNFNYTFYNSGIKNIYFPAINGNTFVNGTGRFNNMLGGVTGCTIHLPSNFDPTNPDKPFDITTLTGYPNFGGTDTIIVYDLSPSIIIKINTSWSLNRYSKGDTSTSYGWVYGDTRFYYTTKLYDIQVGDTVYSDPECTTAYTTVTSIIS